MGVRGGARESMFDLFYIAVGFLFFLGCWGLVKACERL